MQNVLHCALTGHRVITPDFDIEILRKNLARAIGEGVKVFYCGMAIGFDLIAGKEILEIKKTNPDIKLIACIPFEGYEKKFSADDKRLFAEVKAGCDEVITLRSHYRGGCMLWRDRYMVDRADIVIAYVRFPKGGAKYTANYALEHNKRVFLV